MQPSGEVRVLVLAAYPAVRAGLRSLLEAGRGIAVVGELGPGADRSDAAPADVLVLDAEGVDDPSAVLDNFAGVPAVILVPARDAIDPPRGAHALLHRDTTAAELAAAVAAVAAGLVAYDPALAPAPARALLDPTGPGEPLTARELDILRQLALGLPNKTIALNLQISEHTVKFHVSAVLAKLGAASRTEAVMLAARRGLLPL